MSTGLLNRDGLRSGRGGVWSYISASRLNAWLRCPVAFELQYVQGIRLPVTPNLFLGKLTHVILEDLYRHRQLGVMLGAEDLERRMLERWGNLADEEGMRFKDAGEEQALQRQAMELARAYLSTVPDTEKPLAVELALETSLIDPTSGENLGIPLVGVIDLIVDSEEGPVVADFKTTSRSTEPAEVVHEIQLSCYAWLFRQTDARSEAGLEIRSLVKTKTPKIEIHRYESRSEAHFRRLFAVIRAYLDDLDSKQFVFRPGFGCGICEFKDTYCRRWCPSR